LTPLTLNVAIFISEIDTHPWNETYVAKPAHDHCSGRLESGSLSECASPDTLAHQNKPDEEKRGKKAKKGVRPGSRGVIDRV
jgi:hypothetical protein